MMNDSSSELSASSCAPTDQTSLREIVSQLGLNTIHRHIFLCADQTKPKCCSKKESIIAWDYLKKRLKELGLDKPNKTTPSCIFRTKANCLRVCQEGPILLIYPDGVWYRNATPPVIERIIQEHLINNKIVEEYVFLTHPLAVTDEINSSDSSTFPPPEPAKNR